jgi:hypothetical protein
VQKAQQKIDNLSKNRMHGSIYVNCRNLHSTVQLRTSNTMKIVYVYDMFPEKMLRLIIASSMFVHSQSWPSSEQSPGICNVYFI